MKLYMAGGVQGNLGKWFWDNMNLYLTTTKEFHSRLNILESFYYIKPWQIELIPKFKSFMLDSGAFTFMQNKNIKSDFEKYTYAYCEFINKHGIKLFFEMDIDLIVGLKEVNRLRKIIEKETGKLPIWILQQGRTLDDFKTALSKYDYFAIPLSGATGFSSQRRAMIPEINHLCSMAHSKNKKMHGLGFSGVRLKEYKFDSVDSTAWTYGNRGKFLYEFQNGVMNRHHMTHQTNKLKARETAIHNFMQWVKWGECLEGIHLAGTFTRKYVIEK